MDKSRPFAAIDRDLLRFKAFYFFFLSGFGSLFPYLPVYFRQIGLSASHVGLLIGMRPIVQLASAPFWAIMADKYKKRKAILVMSILAWLVMTLAMAFVEPTDGICEVREENGSISRFVNYTKIKTGFFRRSLATSEKYPEGQREEELENTSTGLSAVPLKRVVSQDAYITDPNTAPMEFQDVKESKRKSKATDSVMVTREKKTPDLSSSPPPNVSNDKSIDLNNQRSTKPGWGKNKTKIRRPKEENLDEFGKVNQISQNNRINKNKSTTGDHVSLVFNNFTIRDQNSTSRFKKNDGYHPRTQRTLPRRITKKAISTDYHRIRKKTPGFSSVANVNQGESRGDEKTGASLSDINNQHNSMNHGRKNLPRENILLLTSPRATRHKARGIEMEFSKGDFINSHSSEEQDGHTHEQSENNLVESGSAELETSGSHSGTENIKDAAQKLKIQIARSVNFLSSMADNSSQNLLEQTIAMFSHKNATSVEGQRNASQLSSAFRNLIKSSQKYISSKVHAEHSAEDSSSLHTKHDLTNLAHLMINQKDELTALDNLHQEKSGNSNKDVIHHSVLPDHVIPYSHGNETAVLQGDHAHNHISFASGMEINLFGGNKIPKEDAKQGSSEEKIKEVTKHISAFSGDAFVDEINVSTTSEKDVNFEGSSNVKSPSLESPVSHPLQIKLINVLKSNKLEMSRIFTILLIIVVVGEFLESPSFTLADASLLEILGENRRFYGKQRLWGSIGFGVCSFIVGLLLERSRHVVCGEQYTDYMICFCFFGIMFLLTLFVTTSFDFHYSDMQSSGTSVLSALGNVHYGSCLLAACVMGIDFSMCHNFLTWFLEDLGASKSLMGLAVVSRAFADTITFYFAGSIIKAIGQIRIMIMVFISYTVILLTLSILRNPWWAIPVEILDGVTYAMAWSACTSYLAGAVPAECVTTLQGILQGIYWGLGTGSGTITGGYLIHHIGAASTFRITAAFTFLVCLLFSTIQWKWTNGAINEYPQTKYTYLPAVESKDTEALLRGYELPRDKRKRDRTKTRFNDPY